MSGSVRVLRAPERVTPSGIVYTLHPGQVACAGEGERMETLLGSCVAIILTDPRRTIGAMCHIVHAKPAVRTAPHTSAHAGVALDSMYKLLIARGITPRYCEAYVYGGGNMFPELVQPSTVGDSNSRWALEALAQAGIRVLAYDVGGNAYRRLAWTVGRDAPQVTAVEV